MAIPATTTWEVQTGGSDTANGGHFDVAATGKATDLVATAGTGNTTTPEVSSASYNFVAGDVGHWLYIQGGTNWTPGWYQITSVSLANKATVNAAVGAGVLPGYVPSTAAGVATVGSPTGGTWAIDYSQVGPVPFALTGLSTAAANAILLTASATVAMVGNGLVITGGTNFTTGWYTVIAASAGVSLTVDRTATSAAGAAGTAGLGGALATPGKVAGLITTGNDVLIKTGTYSFTTGTANSSGGPVSSGISGSSEANPTIWEGYQTLRGDLGTPPTIQATASSTNPTLMNFTGNFLSVRNFILDGNSRANARGFAGSGSANKIAFCKAMGCDSSGIRLTGEWEALACRATANTAAGFGFGFDVTGAGTRLIDCVADGNTTNGFNSTSVVTLVRCVSVNNTGTTKHGFNCGSRTSLIDCVAYGNSGDGFRLASTGTLLNCLAYGNSGWGFGTNAATILSLSLRYCAGGTNTLGNYSAALTPRVYAFQALSADPFTNAAGGDFTLNTTTGGGALLRNAGGPPTLPGLTGTGYADIGAFRHQDPAGGGGGNWIGAL